MTNDEFNAVLERRLELTKSVLQKKAGEYASSTDRFHNFNKAADILGQRKEQALIGMAVKHIVSVLDIVDNLCCAVPSTAHLEEKIGDTINYMILLEAMIKERIDIQFDAIIKYGEQNDRTRT